jgi:hypothetical protein
MNGCLAAAQFFLCGSVGDSSGIRDACRECMTLAQDTQTVTDHAQSQGQLAVTYSRDICTVLEQLRPPQHRNEWSALFVQIQDLIREQKARKTIAIVTEMDDMALDIFHKTVQLQSSLQKGIDTLPDLVKDELEQEELEQNNHPNTTGTNNARSMEGNQNNPNLMVREGDDDAVQALSQQLLSMDDDIDEMNTNTRSFGDQVTLFTASQTGRSLYETLTQKQSIVVQVFQNMKHLLQSILRILQVFVQDTESVSCCDRLQALSRGVRELFTCRRYIQWMHRAAEKVRSMIEAIGKFVSASWNQLQQFGNQFQAAKRIGSFISTTVSNVVGGGTNTMGNVMGSIFGGGGNQASGTDRSEPEDTTVVLGEGRERPSFE